MTRRSDSISEVCAAAATMTVARRGWHRARDRAREVPLPENP